MELNAEKLFEMYPDLKDKLSNTVLNGTNGEEKVSEELLEKAMLNLRRQRRGAQVFCVGCGAINKTLYKHGKVYLCRSCKEKLKERINE